mgnify:CR=1 FL=1
MSATKPVTWKSKTNWRTKLERPKSPKLIPVPGRSAITGGYAFMLVPTPLEVDAQIRKLIPGEIITISKLRERLAEEYHADYACPLTVGVFLRTVGETAEEDARGGREDITPYWRVVQDDMTLNPKLPGGIARQARYLQQEGHLVRDNRVVYSPR